jgi:hypothetical protein
MDPPPELDAARAKVLATLAEHDVRPRWTAPQIAVHADLWLDTVLRALTWLRDRKLIELRVWAAIDSLYEITPTGQEALAAGAQLALDVS